VCVLCFVFCVVCGREMVREMVRRESSLCPHTHIHIHIHTHTHSDRLMGEEGEW